MTLAEAMAALPDGSLRQVTVVAGVSDETVRRARLTASTNVEPDEPPARVIGADGKPYPGRALDSRHTVEWKEARHEPTPHHGRSNRPSGNPGGLLIPPVC